MNINKIRNFSIIAHIDHGKSTLADRILEITNTIEKRELNNQHLDQLSLEKERGITIKLNAVQIEFEDYIFHLIDTPGHVDFAYEVSRSLAACEGVILVVDATQGIEAQTLANVYLALENDLEIIPVINKIDLPSADVEKVKKEIEDTIGIDASNSIPISAKKGIGIENVLNEVIKKIPPPINNYNDNKLRGLIFDSYFDSYRGVILLVRIFSGKISPKDNFKLIQTKTNFTVVELGIRTPIEVKKNSLSTGEVGWIAASIRDAKNISIGDTITLTDDPIHIPLPGYKKLQPVVYAGFYPIDSNDYMDLKDSLEKISLSDSSITFVPESSKALGMGFRCGFLGLLHMEVLQERLEREFGVQIIVTPPSVELKVYRTNDTLNIISNPSDMPDRTEISKIEEPLIKSTIILPKEYVGGIMELCQNKRGIYVDLEYIDSNRNKLIYKLPLMEIIFDFFDKLKSISKGYASFDYEIIGYEESKLIKLDILLNGERVDALSTIAHVDFAERRGRQLASKLKEVVPRQAFEIPIQATIGSKIIARENIKAYRKDVTAKLYGGDVTRRKKLLEKQKAGKKRMKKIGKVSLPQEAFISILKIND